MVRAINWSLDWFIDRDLFENKADTGYIMLTFLSVSSPFPTERGRSISATVALNLINFNALFTLHAKRKSVNKVLKCIYIYIYRCITFCVKRVLKSLIFRLYRECVKCCVCCVVFCCVVLCWCFTALRHFSGHFGRGQLTYPHYTWASLLGS